MELVSGTQQRTIYEYHRVELDTKKITGYSAVEFSALPSKCSWKDLSFQVSVVADAWAAHAPPSLSAQPVFSTIAVTCASPPTKPLAAAGAMFSRGARAVGVIQTPAQITCTLHMPCLPGVRTAWIDTDRTGWTLTVRTRCDWTSGVKVWLSLPTLLTILLHGQSKNATCDEYASDDSSTVSPVTQGMEGTTPQFNTGDEGEAE